MYNNLMEDRDGACQCPHMKAEVCGENARAET